MGFSQVSLTKLNLNSTQGMAMAMLEVWGRLVQRASTWNLTKQRSNVCKDNRGPQASNLDAISVDLHWEHSQRFG